MYITNIPDSVLLENILPLISMEELCKFGRTDKHNHFLAKSNDVWKIHYLKSIPEKWKITSNSIHTFGDTIFKYENTQLLADNPNKFIYSYQTPDARHYHSKLFDIYNPYNQPLRSNCIYIGCPEQTTCLPGFAGPSFISYNEPPLVHETQTVLQRNLRNCMCTRFHLLNYCEQNSFKTSHLSSNITNAATLDTCLKDTNCLTSIHQFIDVFNVCASAAPRDRWLPLKTEKLRTKILDNWKQYNEQRGLSQYCQNPLHYDLDTLEIPDKIKNYKNIKALVIQKEFNKKKNAIMKTKTYTAKKNKILSRMSAQNTQLRLLENEYSSGLDIFNSYNKSVNYIKKS